jgi:signal transduction histidine kinase
MVTSTLPARRFAAVRRLIGAALVLLLAVVLVVVQGMLAMGRAANQRAAESAAALAQLLSTAATDENLTDLVRGLPDVWGGAAVIERGRVVARGGLAGPEAPAWWPWSSREQWIASGWQVAGPLALMGQRVMVAYVEVGGGRAVRVVHPIPTTSPALRGRWMGAALGLAVAGAGVLLAWVLIGRALSPYRDLLAEAARLAQRAPDRAEDRYLVETFREAVRRLEESEAQLQRRADELQVLADVLTRASEVGVVITDTQGAVRAANRVALELVDSALAVGEPPPSPALDGEGRRKLGARTVEVRRLPLPAASGTTQGEVLFLTDRTRLEALERALEEREHLASLGELAAGLAHEVRNALATIHGYLRLLRDAGEDRRPRYVEAIIAETEGLDRLVDRFLAFTRPRELHREQLELREVLREAVVHVGQAHPRLDVRIEGDGVTAAADRTALLVVFENLLRNAAEARADAHVVIRVEAAADGAVVTVEDNGPGVPANLRESLFAPFVSSKPSGGLGLALARRLLRLLGGELSFDREFASGARFVVWLPREEMHQ